MPRTNREVERTLEFKFGFRTIAGRDRHRWYELALEGGPAVRTCVSHGRQEITALLESKMARQLRVTTAYFREMLACTQNREDYYGLVHKAE